VARHGPAVRRAVTDGLRSAFDFLTQLVAGRSKAAKRKKAIAVYATLVGTMVLARAADDQALSEEILEAGLASVSKTNV
jgi:TetR/AcrR family transcriptional repressor of nem operon